MIREKQVLSRITVGIGPNTLFCSNNSIALTLQVPHYLLEEAILKGTGSETHIVCTQPRRISAISIASRVSEEFGEPDVGGLVGYSVRLETRSSRRTQLQYCTTGVLLRRLQSDPLLAGTSHIVVDEVHERSLETDFLLILVRHLLRERSDLKVILMSATVDAQLFSGYFGGAPIVEVPGRTFPCTVYHLEDVVKMTNYRIDSDSPYALEEAAEDAEVEVAVTGKAGEMDVQRVDMVDLASRSTDATFLDPSRYDRSVRRSVVLMDPWCINHELIEELLLLLEHRPEFRSVDGAVLLFLPSLASITALQSHLEDHAILGDDRRYLVIPLHGVLGAKDQRKAFDRAPRGVRKIVLATNIAETGITIPDVVFVVDCGFENAMSYNPATRVSGLRMVRISQASAKQRGGRAGRVQSGFVFRLFTQHCFETEMEEHTRPEMLRQPLEQLCLQVLDMGTVGHPWEFLSLALSPPSKASVDTAMNLLDEVGALVSNPATNTVALSPLGGMLAKLPLEPFIGRMIVYAAMFRCLTPIAVMAAATQSQSPFYRPRGRSVRFSLTLSSDVLSEHFSILLSLPLGHDLANQSLFPPFSHSDFCPPSLSLSL